MIKTKQNPIVMKCKLEIGFKDAKLSPISAVIYSNNKCYLIISERMQIALQTTMTDVDISSRDTLQSRTNTSKNELLRIVINKNHIFIPISKIHVSKHLRSDNMIIGYKFLLYLQKQNIDIFNKPTHIPYIFTDPSIKVQIGTVPINKIVINTRIDKAVELIISYKLYQKLQNQIVLTGEYMEFHKRCIAFDDIQDTYVSEPNFDSTPHIMTDASVMNDISRSETYQDAGNSFNKITLPIGTLNANFFLFHNTQMVRLANLTCAVYGSETSEEKINCFLSCRWLKLIMQFNIGPF